MSQILLTRTRVIHREGATILYSTDKGTLEQFGIEHGQEFSDIGVIY